MALVSVSERVRGESLLPGSTGRLTINNGAKLVLTGNALSTPENVRNTFLAIGGRLATASGNGTVSVSGNGSEIIVQGTDALIGIGRGAGVTGSLTVSDRGRVASTNLVVGETGGSGELALDNGRLALTGHRSGNLDTGAGMTVGRGVGANGTMTLSNGARVTIASDKFNGGMSVGGDQFVSGGSGVVSLKGGSSI